MRDIVETGVIAFSGPVDSEVCGGSDPSFDTVNPLIEKVLRVHHNAVDSLPLTLLWSSRGGELDGGLALMGVLQHVRHEGRQVHIHVTGTAASIGHQILQVADRRTIEPHGYLLLHEMSWGLGEESTASKHRMESEAGERLMRQFISLWTLRTGRPYEYYRKKIAAGDWYLTAKEALEEGLVDEILSWESYPIPAYKPEAAPKRKRTKPAVEASDGS